MDQSHRFAIICKFTVVLAISLGAAAHGQVDNPVYVDDSPQAWELFRQADDQAAQNAGEAVRLYQELLDDFGQKLIPASEAASDHFKGVRQRVLDALLRQTQLLDRYRTIQQPVAAQMLEAGELEKLAATRSLTEAGLEALLRLAQRDLEAGRFNTATSWLQQAAAHPDCTGRRALHTHFMIGTAAFFLGDSSSAHAALDQLQQIVPQNAESLACQLELAKLLDIAPANNTPANNTPANIAPVRSRLALTASPFVATTAGPAASSSHADDLNDVVAQTIWSAPLEDSLARRRDAITNDDEPFAPAESTSTSTRRLDRTADLTTAVPTVCGEMVYINEGHTIRAINRLTGRQVWKYANLTMTGMSDRESLTSLDVNVIAVDPGARGATSLVTLTGYAQPGGRSEAGRLICLDAQNGSLRWSANLNGLVDASTTDQLFAHGAPIIAEGITFISARRMSMQSMTSAYVIALDLQTGQVQWVRYIASSGGLQARIRPFCTLNYQDGALHVASAVGAAAKLDPASGEIIWLHRFATPITLALADQVRRPWELGGPVVTRRGVLAIEPDQRHVTLLDTETGAPLASVDAGTASGWNQPRYLLADDEMVFAIGAEIRAFHLDDLENPVWRLPQPQRSEVNPTRESGRVAASADSIDIRGRVQLISGALVVSTSEGVLVVDAESGTLKNLIPIQPPGNPLAIESQLLVAASDRLDAYMSFGKAERMLRDRIAQAPAEPEPALSMVRLAMRVRNLPLALEAAELARRAIDRAATEPLQDPGARSSADSRAELLSLLLEIADARMAETTADGELLFGAIDTAATDPPQRVEYLLAYGQWLSGHSLNRAVETYQTILSNRVLAEAWRVREGVMRPSAAWARERLSELIAQRGAAVYSPQADFAALRLKQSLGANPAAADPAQLQAIAEEFPFSEAAVQAALQAASILAQRGEHRAAAAAVLTLYRANPQTEPARRLLGKFISVCSAAGWNSQVNAAVGHAARAHGDMTLVTDSGTINPTTWLASRAATTARLPVIGEAKPQGDAALEAEVIAGSLVEPYRHSASAGNAAMNLSANRALFRIGNSVRLYGTEIMAGGGALWTTTIPMEMPQLLFMDDRDVLLWIKSGPQGARAMMLNAADGKVRWTSPGIYELLPEASPARGMQMPDGEAFDPAETLALVSEHSLFMVQRAGGVVALDRRDGRAVRWLRKAGVIELEQVHFAALHDCALVLAGLGREIGSGADQTLVPRIVALDPLTGTPILDEASALIGFGRSAVAGVKWMRISPMAELVVGTAWGMHVLDLYSGQRRWSGSAYGAADSQRAWLLDLGAGGLIIEDQRSRLRSVDLGDGAVSETFEVALRGEWDPLDLRSLVVLGSRVIVQYPQRIVVYDPATGAVVGSDVISDDRDYRFLLPAQGKLALVNSRVMQAPVPDQPGRRAQQWEYMIYLLSDNGKVLAEPLKLKQPLTERVQQAALIDGWLLLSTATDTVLIPLK